MVVTYVRLLANQAPVTEQGGVVGDVVAVSSSRPLADCGASHHGELAFVIKPLAYCSLSVCGIENSEKARPEMPMSESGKEGTYTMYIAGKQVEGKPMQARAKAVA